MNEFDSLLDWIDEQHPLMLDRVIEWSKINSYSFNKIGLKLLSKKILDAFEPLEADQQNVELLPFKYVDLKGEAKEIQFPPPLIFRKRPLAPKQAIFVIHMDTSYPPEDSLEEAYLIVGRYLRGKGVVDAKGGIAVLLTVLEALEKSDAADTIGWRAVINTDEEIGSPCSGRILEFLARDCDMGFVFEPCLPDGNLIGSRKGAGFFTIVARDNHHSEESSNAIEAVAACVSRLQALNGTRPGLTVNAGMIQGGKAANLVPHVAVLRFEVKVKSFDDQFYAENKIQDILDDVSREKKIKLALQGKFFIPPKPLDAKTYALLEHFHECGEKVGLDIDWKDSSLVCDGNILQSAGVPTIDSLGVQGSLTSSVEEKLYIDSLKERAKLVTFFLLKWAKGQLAI